MQKLSKKLFPPSEDLMVVPRFLPENLPLGRFWCKTTSQKTVKDFGSLVCSSILRKRGRSFGFWVKRRYFLVGKTLLYTKVNTDNVIKGFVDLDYVKCKFRRTQSGKRSSIILHYNGVTIELFADDLETFNMWQRYLRTRVLLDDYREKYQFEDQIGSGSTGKVYRVSIAPSPPASNKGITLSKSKSVGNLQTFSGLKFAAKVINKKNLKDTQKLMVLEEIKHLRLLDHPGVVKLYEVHEVADEICLIMELIEGGPLYKQIKLKKKYSEEESIIALRKLLEALTYLQSMNIVHRDIKPENILLRDINDLSSLVLVDFGLSCTRDSETYFKVCGTPGYIAPEILNKMFYLPFEKIDVFSLGCIFYELLTEKFLFHAKSSKDTTKLNTECLIDFDSKELKVVSSSVRSLMQMMLEKDPNKRISVKEAMEHNLIAACAGRTSNLTTLMTEESPTNQFVRIYLQQTLEE